jgi:TonB family protein
MFRYALATTLAVALNASAIGAQPGFVPASYVSGGLPAIPVLAVSGGEVFLEVLVADDGHVDSVNTLRTTPPFTDAVISAVRGWRFKPAAEAIAPLTGQGEAPARPVKGSVFVAAMFAPPALYAPTLGQPPRDVASPSAETPGAIVANAAGYPLRALGDGMVLVEVAINGAGAVTGARVVLSSPAFDAAAVAAARSWLFVGARRGGSGVPALAYLMFAFRAPVTGLPEAF